MGVVAGAASSRRQVVPPACHDLLPRRGMLLVLRSPDTHHAITAPWPHTRAERESLHCGSHHTAASKEKPVPPHMRPLLWPASVIFSARSVTVGRDRLWHPCPDVSSCHAGGLSGVNSRALLARNARSCLPFSDMDRLFRSALLPHPHACRGGKRVPGARRADAKSGTAPAYVGWKALGPPRGS